MTKEFEEWLLLIPQGWAKAFSEELYSELYAIDPELTILDMKEKWGHLDIYFVCSKNKYWDRVNDICEKYWKNSVNYCAICGKPGELRKAGWVIPLCDKCYSKWEDKHGL